ncbi:hypothetical protein BaRGS_00034544 [Batillaria attramentaria]|uniref:Cadherin domain-containing protein n=1 Tax=Batillaria attramentaria TaxID=370345 RepID=A0ABD0JHL7_9CAEN
MATTRTSRTGTLTVEVDVSDVNDNAPRFSKETFEMTVMETAPVGTIFGRLTASDGDVGPNGQLSFKFSLLTRAEVLELFQAQLHVWGESWWRRRSSTSPGRPTSAWWRSWTTEFPPQVSQAGLQIIVADAGNTATETRPDLADPVFGDQSAMLYEDVQLGTFRGLPQSRGQDDGFRGRGDLLQSGASLLTPEPGEQRYGIVVTKSLDRETQQELNATIAWS